ncbi:MAG TPA: hypothetical protein DCL35_00400 [Candidatus Omnitrophica bacterium]|nr:hypothetical protein [Candidatus Omnitrophota bacterium]
MNNASKNQQIEFEVFPKEKTNFSYLSGVQSETPGEGTQINVVFSHQSVIIIFICAVMLLVASFALGVEKGKLVAKNSPEAGLGPVTLAAQEASETKPVTTAQEKTAITADAAGAQAADNAAQNTAAEPQVFSAPAGNFAIQVASVKSESAAKSLAETLTKKGISSFTRSSGNYTVVLAGNFAKREEAQQSLKELKKSYSDCFIRKI